MCIAIVVVVITKLRVATMQNYQDTWIYKNIEIIEIAVWTFWILFIVAGNLIS
jgi:hypothetical protein